MKQNALQEQTAEENLTNQVVEMTCPVDVSMTLASATLVLA